MEEIRRIKDVYPDVDYIKIKYIMYESLDIVDEREFKISSDHRCDYGSIRIRCNNRLCTSKGFDLCSEISDAIHRKERHEYNKGCTGKLSEKYIRNSNQTCDCSIKFTVEAVFLKNN